jgi:hypothetical protein
VHHIDESLDHLYRAGGSVGHAAFGKVWQVDDTNGENVVIAKTSTLAEAYRLACLQAQAVGIAREDWCRGSPRRIILARVCSLVAAGDSSTPAKKGDTAVG